MQENGLKAEGQITKNTKSIICILLGNTHSFYENLTGKYKECIFQNMAVNSSSQDQYATQRPQRDHKPKAACNEVCSGPPLCTCVEQHYQVPQSVRKFSLVHFYQQVQLRQGTTWNLNSYLQEEGKKTNFPLKRQYAVPKVRQMQAAMTPILRNHRRTENLKCRTP